MEFYDYPAADDPNSVYFCNFMSIFVYFLLFIFVLLLKYK